MATGDMPLPGYTPSSGGETPPPEGMRGEVADNPDLERPDLRREVQVEGARRVVVEDSSGTAFAEAAGVSGLVPPPPEHAAASAPRPVAEPQTPRNGPALFAAAFLGGVLLAMLTGSSRRRSEEPDPALSV